MAGSLVQLDFMWDQPEVFDTPWRDESWPTAPEPAAPQLPAPETPATPPNLPAPAARPEPESAASGLGQGQIEPRSGERSYKEIEPRSGERSYKEGRAALIQGLQAQIERVERRGAGLLPRGLDEPEISEQEMSWGLEVLERLLPAGGFRRGVIVEWIAMNAGAAAGYLAWLVAAQALRRDTQGGVLVVIDRRDVFYPPAALAAGVPAERLVIVKPKRDQDAVWAIDQALRSPAVCAVWGELTRLDDRAARRLQLAAEQGPGLGLLTRPASAAREPSWAEVRWQVTGLPHADLPNMKVHSRTFQEHTREVMGAAGGRQLQVELSRCRGGRAGASCLLEIDDSTGQLRELTPVSKVHGTHIPRTASALHLAAELAHPAAARRTGTRNVRRA